MAITGMPSLAVSRTARVPPAAGPGAEGVAYTLPTTRKSAPSSTATAASRALCTDRPIQPRGRTRRASAGRDYDHSAEFRGLQWPQQSGRPLTKTAASGGRASARRWSAMLARTAPPASRSLACSATAEPPAAIAAARTPKSPAASTPGSVMREAAAMAS